MNDSRRGRGGRRVRSRGGRFISNDPWEELVRRNSMLQYVHCLKTGPARAYKKLRLYYYVLKS